MYTIFILFFISLAGIAIMIGRKVALVRNENEQTEEPEHFHPFVPDFQKIKHLAYKNAQKYGYLALVSTIRFSVRSSNLMKKKGNQIYDMAQRIVMRNRPEEVESPKEVSKFLKKISEYKSKIRRIKHKIIEEEKNS
jgi:hypothetical protein